MTLTVIVLPLVRPVADQVLFPHLDTPDTVRPSHCRPVLGGQGTGGEWPRRRRNEHRYDQRASSEEQDLLTALFHRQDVRFKNQGLDSIEVQDNGGGISPDNYESLALKHYTSKLTKYADLGTLETFGFRGEALSSLCALSRFIVTTCLHSDVPKGTRLDFETSGKLKGTTVIAAQKGTTVSVESLFQNLPVRRRELERNIKREWGKVISLLNQYACVQTGVKFTVSQQPNKGKRIVLFSTKGNKTTRENIINVFGAKTMSALVGLDLKLELELTSGSSQRWSTQEDGGPKEVLIKGFVSKPVHGEGRQTPDRQMFYVNSRPCGLPQFAKIFNEVYRSFNSSQSPFIFANIQLDTHLYDVNVSPDKRTILLHDQSRMLENLRGSLTELFEQQDFTVPVSQITPFKQPPLKKLSIARQESSGEGSVYGTTPGKAPNLVAHESREPCEVSGDESEIPVASRIENLAAAKILARDAQASDLMSRWVERTVDSREQPKSAPAPAPAGLVVSPIINETAHEEIEEDVPGTDGSRDHEAVEAVPESNEVAQDSAPPVEAAQGEDDFLTRLARMKRSFLPESLRADTSDSDAPDQPPIPAISKPVKLPDNAPLSVSTARPPKRLSQEVATITVGEHTVTSIIGTPSKRTRLDETAPAGQRHSQALPKMSEPAAPLPSFRGRLTQMFAATAVKHQLPANDEPLEAEATESDDESPPTEESQSEGSPESLQEADTASDKSSPLFVEQDEEVDEDDPRSSSSEEENGDEAIGEKDVEKDSEYDDEDTEMPGNPRDQETITAAEEAGEETSEENKKRTQVFLKGGGKGRYSTQALLQRLKVDTHSLQRSLESWETLIQNAASAGKTYAAGDVEDGLEVVNAEEKLALAIHKGDFNKMKIVGQFNLGFVLAVRPKAASKTTTSTPVPTPTATDDSQAHQQDDDELFIIDQHASDEKFNFERLQASTVVQSQRLVRPKPLELTAVEEEVVIENQDALEKNGFVVSIDESGDEPVGSRCRLLSLPLSRETTFSLGDLEELISLLADNPTATPILDDDDDSAGAGGVSGARLDRYVPRPSKVRNMFAMRACRSSIMIGKALSRQQMERVVRHMGEMEKPWNCPHGRPTMRHLCGLGAAWDDRGWRENGGGGGDNNGVSSSTATDWAGYVKQMREST